MQMADLLERLQDALVSRYRIIRELGAGGAAVVFLGDDLRHRRQVALKVLRPELAAQIGPERFLREIETAARLAHPHILPVHDSGEAAGFLYYVMPYVEGESLRERLTREKQLPLDEALQIAREVADALTYAHNRDVVHRDIKPENILLQSEHAVVADFGIARAMTLRDAGALTATGMTLGTPIYMSPEQAAGSGDLDGRSDLYSLGCVLYEMLAGQPPFTGPTAESLVHQHLTVAAPSVTNLRPAVPGSIAAAVQRALAKTPADRFSRVALFAEALVPRESANVTAASPAKAVTPARRWWRLGLLAGMTTVAAIVALIVLRPGGHTPGPPASPMRARTEVAVLPFQNLSADGSYSYFAGGLQDELLTQLSKVAALKVISRTSVMGYSGTSKPLKVIASELGVGSVVEGSVQVVGGRLRVTVQLIDAATDEHLWAEHYDRKLDDAFAIQSEVAQRIVAAVGAALNDAEQAGLAAAATPSAEAYRLYLQGNEYYFRPGLLRQDRESAQQLYAQALALDPNFALAHAALSGVHGQMYWLRYDPTPARAARQSDEAETALRLAPDLPQAHMAMGRAYYQARRDYHRALDEYAIALKGLPNDAELWNWIGNAQRRLGNWSEALAAYEKGMQLDPRNATLFFTGAPTFRLMRRYADAMGTYDRALSLAPDLHGAQIGKAWIYVAWQGQLDTLRAVVGRLPSDDPAGPLGGMAFQRAELLLWERDADGLLQMPQVARGEPIASEFSFVPGTLYAAWAYQWRGDRAEARRAFDDARARLDLELKELPDDWRVHAARGLTLAGLGRRDEALGEARWLQQSNLYRNDAFEGTKVAESRAQILAQAGDAEAALDEIGRLLARPSWLTVQTLRLDPRWDPIRDVPRFKTLLAKFGHGSMPDKSDRIRPASSRSASSG